MEGCDGVDAQTTLIKKYFLACLIMMIALFPITAETKIPLVTASEELPEAVSSTFNNVEEQLRTILDNPLLRGGITGISVRKVEDGAIVYSDLGMIRLRPASNMKLLTGAAALSVLGPDYQFSTAILTDGRIQGDTLMGNLYIRGKGDPTLLEKDLIHFAKQLKELGINNISGALLGDDRWYDAERYSQDLNWSDEHSYVGSQISALTMSPNEDFDGGTIIVEVTAGANVSAPPTIGMVPQTDSVEIITTVKTVASGKSKAVTVEREHGSNRIYVTGQVPVGAKKVRSWVAVWEPGVLVLDVFKNALNAEGIKLGGKVEMTEKSIPASATVLASKKSMPVEDLFIPFMKLSNNGLAEVLIKEMGKVRLGEGSWKAGLRVMEDELNGFGLNTETMVLRDGSGMSHKNLVPADELTTLLVNIQDKPWFPAFKKSLPIAGDSGRMVGGTLRNRMSDVAAHSSVMAKTGSITGVSSLSGYVTAADGTELVFAILINNYVKGPVSPIEDAVVKVLSEVKIEEK
jgi:D-alanyl-D-alanine carboxypeptidase/D-alanyl-D-alanine-endopeptidase (penicillin-binding protein 4)